jgi:hypothetical protein
MIQPQLKGAIRGSLTFTRPNARPAQAWRFEETAMKKTFTAVLAAATVAVVLAGSTNDAAAWRRWGPGSFLAGLVGGAIIAGAIMASRPPGYVVYEGYAEPLPRPDCYWTRQPVFDAYGNRIGWRGRPVAVCE